jgi:hypothetical protein
MVTLLKGLPALSNDLSKPNAFCSILDAAIEPLVKTRSVFEFTHPAGERALLAGEEATRVNVARVEARVRIHNKKMTRAARAMAERKTFGQRS